MLNLIVAVDDACCIVVLALFNVPVVSSNSRVRVIRPASTVQSRNFVTDKVFARVFGAWCAPPIADKV